MLTQNLLTQVFFQTQHFSNYNPEDILVRKFLDKRIFQPKNLNHSECGLCGLLVGWSLLIRWVPQHLTSSEQSHKFEVNEGGGEKLQSNGELRFFPR